MHIKVLGAHCGESQNTKDVCLLIDDTLVIDAGGLTSSLSFPAQERLKAILLTHRHYDHTKDAVVISLYLEQVSATINIYSIPSVYYVLSRHLLGRQYLERPEGNPTTKFTEIEPLKTQQIEGYSVLAVPVNHRVPAVGYLVTTPDGKGVFYTGDTGPGLSECWEHISPQLLFIEATLPNRLEERARLAGHLTPGLLKQELVTFREVKGYLPQIVAVHMVPMYEEEIKAEVVVIADDLNHPITIGYEGMQLYL